MSAVMKLLAGLILVIAMCMLGCFILLAGQQWLVVKVVTRGPDGIRFIAPIPVFALYPAAVLIPDSRRQIELPGDMPVDFKKLAAAVDVLAQCPDGDFVRVVSGGERVQIAKRDNSLVVRVNGAHENLDFQLPLSCLRECLRSIHGREVSAIGLIAALHQIRFTRLAQVNTPEADVTVWSW